LPDTINQRWSLDFVSDALSDGRRFRIFAAKVCGLRSSGALCGRTWLPICEQSDDSIKLRFAVSRRNAKRYRPCGAFLLRFRLAQSEQGKHNLPPVYWRSAYGFLR
jgi:hypothetical protein